jgi:hypothetical protein
MEITPLLIGQSIIKRLHKTEIHSALFLLVQYR